MTQQRLLAIAIVLFLIGIIPAIATGVFAVDRCAQYVPLVRQQHEHYFGLDFPYWYGMGQIRQESRCRADVTAFDGGQGLTQFMPATIKGAEKYLGPLDMYNPSRVIKAQAWYMKQLHKSNWNGSLWLTYCFYNSGYETMHKEYTRAGVTDYNAMKAVCRRRIIILKSGEQLDLCRVGYDYPKQVFRYGEKYKISSDKLRFW